MISSLPAASAPHSNNSFPHFRDDDSTHQMMPFASAGAAAAMNADRRATMEDAHVICADVRQLASGGAVPAGGRPVGFFCVLDGHGGRTVSDFASAALPVNVATLLARGDVSHERVLEAAFLLTDAQSAVRKHATSGATAVVALVVPDADGGRGRKLVVANAGDARAVLCSALGAARLSVDHKADDPEETRRIRAAGGFVLKGRVLGVLAVARALGDHSLKSYVTAAPHVATYEVPDTRRGRATLVLGCDGVWDVSSDDEVSKFVDARRAEGLAAHAIADAIVAEAVRRGSSDNVTAVVVFL